VGSAVHVRALLIAMCASHCPCAVTGSLPVKRQLIAIVARRASDSTPLDAVVLRFETSQAPSDDSGGTESSDDSVPPVSRIGLADADSTDNAEIVCQVVKWISANEF
jgi:hypothetical protein